jgi:acetyltransferase-like isoleucine patch superfamily enzyme
MDSDTHFIFSESGERMNEDKPVVLGDKIWIGCRSVILKGSYIGNNNIIAANTTVTKKFEEENCIIAGSPAKIIKKIGYWEI